MANRVALKRLSSVEVDPARSRQHAFHASRLRQELGFGDTRRSGTLSVLVYAADSVPPISDEASFTLSNVRENNPERSAEWHLYYTSDAIQAYATAGDLAVLFRRGGDLELIIARAGSRAEGELIRSLDLAKEIPTGRSFTYVSDQLATDDIGFEVAAQLTLATTESGRHLGITNHPLVQTAIRNGSVPPSRQLSNAAADLALGGGAHDPDAYLFEALAYETELYFEIEERVHAHRMTELIRSGPTVTDVLDFAMRIQQGRRSRRGQSLQNHFQRVLAIHEIPHSAQCTTERGETPDFVIPGCLEYHDAAYPAAALRMVACKSTAKERWRQVLNEAARIQVKYLLTVDPNLTDLTVRAMTSASVVVFVPRDVLLANYQGPQFAALGTVSDLLDKLRRVA